MALKQEKELGVLWSAGIFYWLFDILDENLNRKIKRLLSKNELICFKTVNYFIFVHGNTCGLDPDPAKHSSLELNTDPLTLEEAWNEQLYKEKQNDWVGGGMKQKREQGNGSKNHTSWLAGIYFSLGLGIEGKWSQNNQGQTGLLEMWADRAPRLATGYD